MNSAILSPATNATKPDRRAPSRVVRLPSRTAKVGSMPDPRDLIRRAQRPCEISEPPPPLAVRLAPERPNTPAAA